LFNGVLLKRASGASNITKDHEILGYTECGGGEGEGGPSKNQNLHQGVRKKYENHVLFLYNL